MQSQSYQAQVATALSAGRNAAPGRTIPSVLFWLVALQIGSSFYVRIEPAPTDLFFLVLLLALVFKRGVRFPIDLNPIPSLGLLTFVAMSAVSLIWAQDFGSGLFFFLVTAYLVVSWYLVIVLLANYGYPMWKLILRAFLAAAAISAAIGLISHFTTVLDPYFPSFAERSRGAFKDPNVYGPFLCAALVLVMNHLVTRPWRFSRELVVMIALVCLYSVEILASFSRGAYVNLGVSLAVFFGLQLFIVQRKDWLTRCFVALGASAALLLPASLVFLDVTGLEGFMDHRLRLQEYDIERFDSQALVIGMLGDAPFGIGPGQSEFWLTASGLEVARATHNLYLRVAVENGLVSAIGFFFFLAATLWICLVGTLRRRGPFRDVYACCLAVLAGILVNSLVIDTLHWRHFFMLLAVPIGLRQYEAWAARAAQPRRDLAPHRRGVQL